MNKSLNYQGFGHLKVVKYLCETFNDDNMNKANNYYGFRLVCDDKHTEITNYLYNTFKDVQ